jgi:hypothetical protein
MRYAIGRGGLTAAVLVVLSVALAGSARAGLVIDQQYSGAGAIFTNYAGIPNFRPLGQSFTPSLSGIDFATFNLLDLVSVAGTYEVQLYSGTGNGGTLLGTSKTDSLAAGSSGATEFDFSSTIALTPGQTYSLMLVRTDSSSDFGAQYGSPGGYAGGEAISSGQGTSNDLIFSEGLITSAVPEPATLAPGALAALAGAGCAWRKRRRAAA